MRENLEIAIIGGGFSGAALACQLSKHCDSTQSIAVFERNERPGRGVAYGKQSRDHLLNVPAGRMSAFPDDPGHFLRWLEFSHPELASSHAFVPRRLFGEYLGDLLEQAMREKPDLRWVEDEAVSIREGGRRNLILGFASGREVEAEAVVLATGNFPPSHPAAFVRPGSEKYLRSAWSGRALEDLEPDGVVLVLGSGLTAIDQVLALRSEGHRGRITMLSRRGMLPAVHSSANAFPVDWTRFLPMTARELWIEVRRQVKLAAEAGIGWRAVIDSLRPGSQEIWRSLSHAEQRRFLRHVRPVWEPLRHRYAPAVQEALDGLRANGQLTVLAGSVLECRYGERQAEVVYRDRRSGAASILQAGRILNCTGPEADVRRLRDRLTLSLMSQALARPGALGLGLDVAPDGALIDGEGQPSRRLFALGPLRKGCEWETTAVNEIRKQAAELARLLHEVAKIGEAASLTV